MKLMYLLFSFTTGGTERLVGDICNQMADNGHEVHLYVVNKHYDEPMLRCLDDRVRVTLQNRPVGGDKLKTVWTVTRYIRQNRIEVVHCNSFDAPELLVLKKLLFPSVHIVHTVHDVGQYAQLPKWKVVLRNWLCDRFVAISDCVKRDIVACGAREDKAVTVYNAINVDRFFYRERETDLSVQIRIGNVARIMPEKKGQDVLIRAVAQLRQQYPQLRCLFAGEPDRAHRESLTRLQDLARELGVEDRVTFLGNVEDVPAFLAGLDIFVLPSRYEGFGISLIEAMATGLPCIASRLDGPEEILEDSRYGMLFESGNEKELANRIAAMLAAYPAWQKTAREAAQMVRQRYDIRNMCGELLRVYQK